MLRDRFYLDRGVPVTCDTRPDDSDNNLSGVIRILQNGADEAVGAGSSRTRLGTQQW